MPGNADRFGRRGLLVGRGLLALSQLLFGPEVVRGLLRPLRDLLAEPRTVARADQRAAAVIVSRLAHTSRLTDSIVGASRR